MIVRFARNQRPNWGGGYFTYESLKKFAEEYDDFLPPESINLYKASNPLDYHDGRYDFYDVAALFGIEEGALSTLTDESMPRFLEYAKAEVKAGIADASLNPLIAISDRSRPIDVEGKTKFRKMVQDQGLESLQIESLTKKYFIPRIIKGEPSDSLSSLGRNYDSSLDYFQSKFVVRGCEGVEITPQGIAGVISIYPTPENPTGRLSFPIRNEDDLIVERHDAQLNLPLQCVFDNSDGNQSEKLQEILGSSLCDVAFLREAYCWRSLAGHILANHPDYEDEGKSKELSDTSEYLRKRIEFSRHLDVINEKNCSETVRNLIPNIKEMIRRFENWLTEVERGNYKTAYALAGAYFYNKYMNEDDREAWEELEQQAYELGKENRPE